MEEEEKKSVGGSSQAREHNCFESNNEVWTNHKDYNCITCSVCGRITNFSFKSWRLRLRFLFWDRIGSIRTNPNQ